jgi:CRP-like cAMP-binding protein
VFGETFPHSRGETLSALSKAAAVRTFAEGETILRQGEENSIAYVLDGHVAMRRTTVDGQQLIMKIVSRGELIVILPVFGRPAGADGIALTAGSVVRFSGAEVRSLMAADPGLAIDLLDRTLAIFESVVGRFDGLFYHDATRRVARVLHVHAGLFFSEPPVLTRAHLPSLIWTSREMTGRVLRVLESLGLVARVGRDRLRLLDPVGLAEVAEHGVDRSRKDRGTSSSSSPR